jgi:hypothetical protein
MTRAVTDPVTHSVTHFISAAGSKLLSLPRRWRRMVRAGQSGQAVTESGVLLAALVAGLFFGGAILNRFHPDMMNALDIYMKGFYFTLSLPFP